MNNFEVQGITSLDLSKTPRLNQVPSIADEDFRGFCCGFASGHYTVLLPFFSGLRVLYFVGNYRFFLFFLNFFPCPTGYFSGKIARLKTAYYDPYLFDSSTYARYDMTKDLQQLNILEDYLYPKQIRGIRGGFVSLWRGAD